MSRSRAEASRRPTVATPAAARSRRRASAGPRGASALRRRGHGARLARSARRRAALARRASNVLLVTLDTTRADRLGCYGHAGEDPPPRPAGGGGRALRDARIAPAPITLPSHASIFTGLYPFEHGVRNNGNFYLRRPLPDARHACSRPRATAPAPS